MKKIIITDDDPGIQDSFKIVLERAGYDVTVFPDGQKLLNNQFQNPELFIIDRQLPGVDGIDICRFLKRQEATKHIPIIILSATPHLEKLAINAGADGFLEKPFPMKRMLDLITTLL